MEKNELSLGFDAQSEEYEPGERWEKALYLHIDGSDLFLLL